MHSTIVDSFVTTRLDRAYVCKKCGMSFLFRSDVEDHEQMMAGHREMSEIPL